MMGNREQLESVYSDASKEAYGFRMRDFASKSDEELEEAIEYFMDKMAEDFNAEESENLEAWELEEVYPYGEFQYLEGS